MFSKALSDSGLLKELKSKESSVVFQALSKQAKVFTKQSRHLTPLEKKAFENIVGKEENAGNQHFCLFSQYFLLFPTRISIFEGLSFCRLQMLRIWNCLKFYRLVES